MPLFRSMGARKDATRGTTALEVRKGLEGLFASPGVVPGATSPLVQGTASFAYQVNRAHFVTRRATGDGVHLFGNDGAVTIATAADGTTLVPPGAGLSRIDIIWVRHRSNGENGDTTSDPDFGVTKGTPASLPVAPSIPTGALEIARNTMTSTATSTSSAGNTIAQSSVRADVVGTPDVRVAFGTSGKVPNSTGLIDAVSFTGVPYPTRIYVQAEGAAGFDSQDVNVGLRVGVGAGVTLTQRVSQPVRALNGQWTNVTRQAVVDVPANTPAGVFLASEVSGGTGAAYFRCSMTLTRVPA